MRSTKLRFLPLLLLTAAFALPARIASAAVSDGAHVFGADAVAQADSIDRDIRQRHALDFNLETFAAVPDDARQDLETKGKAKFFEDWANQRATQTGTNGVYALICMRPGHIQVWVGSHTQQRAFTLQDRSQLEQILAAAFKAKDYDNALTQAAQFVRDRMDSNLGTRAGAIGSTGVTPGNGTPGYGGGVTTNYPSAPAGGGIPIAGWLCLIIGVIAIFAIIRGVLNRPNMTGGGGYPPPPGYQGGPYSGGFNPGYGGGGGGGFGRGLLGGILGGVLGGAGYDWLSGRGRGADWGGQSMPPGGGYDPNTGAQLPGVDTSGSSSGTDFDTGGSSGGSDFGGSSDFGGGDTGGGADFGGGGGDSGSSGGGDF